MGRAILFHGFGQPLERISTTRLQPGVGEILVRITCCTLCRSDLHTHAGRRSEPTPLILGHEIVGRIQAFGPQVQPMDAAGRPAKVGDRITWAVAASCRRCFFCLHEMPQKCESLYKYGHLRTERQRPSGGGLADFILLAPGTYWLCVPSDLPDSIVAPANCATATVAGLFRHACDLHDATVLILGAGMLGLTACAMAQTAGAKNVVVADPDAECLRRAQAFGATHPVPADLAVARNLLADLTQRRGADVVFELAGSANSVSLAIALARTGGLVLLAGTVAPVDVIPLDAEALVRRMLTIRGCHNYHPRDLAAALDFLAGPGGSFPFASLIAATFPLEHVDQAFDLAHTSKGMRVAVVPEAR